jgi:WD40 repeat protein
MEHNIVVSGAEDRTAMIWDVFTSKLIRVIAGYNNPVISVSINKLSGNIAVLTTAKLGIYTVNGTLVSLISLQDFNVNQTVPQDSTGKLSSMHVATYSSPNISMVFKMKPKIVLAPPCADWQDGVVAVTGHEGGFVYLWKIQTIEATSVDTLPSLLVSPLDTEVRPNSYVRRILVPYSTLRAHRADISVLRLCPWIVPKAKPFIPRSFEGENGAELVIGDVDGNVSRWEVGRLEQMSVQDLNSAMSRHQLNSGTILGSGRRPLADSGSMHVEVLPASSEPEGAARPASPNTF